MSDDVEHREPEAGEGAEGATEETLADVAAASADVAAAAVRPVAFGPLEDSAQGEGRSNLDLLLDVSIPVTVEVGKATLPLEKVLELVPGRIVTLDKKFDEPVDLRVNGKLVARGEVVLVDDTYGLRVTEIVDRAGRIESLRGGA